MGCAGSSTAKSTPARGIANRNKQFGHYRAPGRDEPVVPSSQVLPSPSKETEPKAKQVKQRSKQFISDQSTAATTTALTTSLGATTLNSSLGSSGHVAVLKTEVSSELSCSGEDAYFIGEKLGTGGFAQVRACYRNHDGVAPAGPSELAVKIVSIHKKTAGGKKSVNDALNDIVKETHVWQHMMNSQGSKYYVQFVEFWMSQEEGFMVMERCERTLLAHLLQQDQLHHGVLGKLIVEMVAAVKYLHQSKVVHRDIKGDNFLVLDSQIKLCDFGVATVLDAQSLLKHPCGTPPYMAPEMLLNKGYNHAVDVWALGVLLYSIFLGKIPYDGLAKMSPKVKRSSAVKEAIKEGIPPDFRPAVPMPHWYLPPLAESFINMCMTREPRARPAAARLEIHAFLRQYGDLQGKVLEPLCCLKPVVQAAATSGAFTPGPADGLVRNTTEAATVTSPVATPRAEARVSAPPALTTRALQAEELPPTKYVL